MKTIPLATGEVALVDDADFERLNQFKWSLLKSRNSDKQGYAKRGVWNPSTKKVVTVLMHHDVLGKKVRTDHKNGNKLDNQHGNLRPASGTQNAGNSQRRATPGRTSRFKGVCWHKRKGKWHAQLMQTVAGRSKPKTLGYFDDETKAAAVYNEAAKRYFGEFACLNRI